MSIRVGELVSHLRTRSRVLNVRFGDVELLATGDGAGTLRVGEDRFPWGGRNAQMFAGFAKVPYKYLLGEPLEWQRSVVRHHVTKNADADSMWYIEGDSIAGVYQPDAKVIPLTAIAEQVNDVFYPDDIADVLHAPDQVEVNVISKLRTITVPGIEGVESRPVADVVPWDDIMVGDISAGGVRIVIQPGKPERAPFVEEYWLRKMCGNGMTRRVSGSLINLRGRTVPEILLEMNNVMRVIWEGLEGSGRAILHSANTPVPGATSDFIREVARERSINPATVLRLQERGAALHANPSVYDVTQIFTDMANQEGLPVLVRRNLQAIGGDLTVDTDRMVHRCSQCEQPLRDAA